MPRKLEILPLSDFPEVLPGDNLAELIQLALGKARIAPEQGDILVVAQKVVSKAEGSRVRLDSVKPSDFARAWASRWGRDARVVEVVLRESRRIVRMERGLLICETHHGFVCANAGVDLSNAGSRDAEEDELAILLPEDPDRSARMLVQELEKGTGATMGVIVSDSFGRPWRAGLTQVALGVAGLPALVDYREQADGDGRPLQATEIAVADQIASAADLVSAKALRIPVALVRGMEFSNPGGNGQDLIRDPALDLFR